MTAVKTQTVTTEDADIRLDRWFKRHYPALTHGRLEKLLRTGQVRIDGRRAKASLRLAAGQTVRVPPLGDDSQPKKKREWRTKVDARDAAFLRAMILHQDDLVIALEKPSGLPVQGGTKSARNLDAMLDALATRQHGRPKLVHRLDRDTSGVLLLARTPRAATELTAAFRQKSTRKLYWAAVVGLPSPDTGTIKLALAKRRGGGGERVRAGEGEGAKWAQTHFAVLDHAAKQLAFVAFQPVTGRTHQVRVHAAEGLGTPILGDGKYGGAGAYLDGVENARTLHLHARRIVVPHPAGGVLDIAAPLPDHMRKTWDAFGFDPDDTTDPFEELDQP